MAIATGGAVAAIAPSQSPSTEHADRLRELVELQSKFNELRAAMERPITVSIVMDSRELARHTVVALPGELAKQGLL